MSDVTDKYTKKLKFSILNQLVVIENMTSLVLTRDKAELWHMLCMDVADRAYSSTSLNYKTVWVKVTTEQQALHEKWDFHQDAAIYITMEVQRNSCAHQSVSETISAGFHR